MATGERKLFKDWFDESAARQLADQIGQSPEFDREIFLQKATENLESLEMQGRVRQFASALAAALPDDPARALGILRETLPEAQTDCDSVNDGWLQWPIGQFIADYGLEHFDEAFETMIELTKRFSAEFAIRPFLESEPKEVLARLLALTTDPNPHVRRWCSEGVRTRLPWGKKLHHLIEDPSGIWPILEALKDDPEKYVQKSVANNLNDLAKDHPDAVVSRCRDWMRDATPQRKWIVKHALRTLIKDGDPEALAIVGFGKPKQLQVDFGLEKSAIAIGETLPMILTLRSGSATTQSLMIDFAVRYVRKAGKTSAKVFKWKEVVIAPGESMTLQKSHAFRPTSIRALYPGKHDVEVQINGHRVGSASFELEA